MKAPWKHVCALWLITRAICRRAVCASAEGDAILLVGGGKTTPAIIRELLKLAGSANTPIVILAQTEADPVTGAPESIALFRAEGATNVTAPVGRTPEQIIELLKHAKAVWIPGGDQNRFTTLFPPASGVPNAIRAVWRRGGVVGGTSAGASLLGEKMPTGEPPKAEGLRVGAASVVEGLNVLPHTLIDQHFLVRNRFQRLLAGVLEHPDLLGIGLDENDWALIQQNVLYVKAGQVTLVRVSSPVHKDNMQLGAEHILLSILLSGERISLQQK